MCRHSLKPWRLDSKPRLAGRAGTSVLRNQFSAVARISDWITEIFGTSYKILARGLFWVELIPDVCCNRRSVQQNPSNWRSHSPLSCLHSMLWCQYHQWYVHPVYRMIGNIHWSGPEQDWKTQTQFFKVDTCTIMLAEWSHILRNRYSLLNVKYAAEVSGVLYK